MATVSKISKAKDKDAEYVLRRVAIMEECEAAERSSAKRRDEAQLEIGQRLVEVRARLVKDKSMSFTAWVEAHLPFTLRTAYNHMEFAGFTEEERTERREKRTATKHAERVKADPDENDDAIPDGSIEGDQMIFSSAFYETSAHLFQVVRFLRSIKSNNNEDWIAAAQYQNELQTMTGYADDIAKLLKGLIK